MHDPGLDPVLKEKDTLLKQYKKLPIGGRLNNSMNYN